MSSWDYVRLEGPAQPLRPRATWPTGLFSLSLALSGLLLRRVSLLRSTIDSNGQARPASQHNGQGGAAAGFVPWEGVEAVLLEPEAPSFLQMLSPSEPDTNCLFSYGRLGESAAFTSGARVQPGVLYGATVSFGQPFARITGAPENVLKGKLICWEAESTFLAKLAESDAAAGYDAQRPEASAPGLRRGWGQVVVQDGSAISALWYYQVTQADKPPPPPASPPAYTHAADNISDPANTQPAAPGRTYDLFLKAYPAFNVVCTDRRDPGATLTKYMQLPLDQTFLSLDMPLGSKIVRVNQTIFKVVVPSVKLFQLTATPTLFFKITQTQRSINFVSKYLVMEGSDYLQSLSDRVLVDARTEMVWKDNDRDKKIIMTTSDINVQVDTPPPFKIFPKPALEAAGNLIMGSFTLTQGAFVRSLAKDYERWANDAKYREFREKQQQSRQA